jgi:dimethylaniline monooxygenase (N-oxide forming)
VSIYYVLTMCRAEDFDGMRVVIVGLGNTGGDIADDLVGHASSISISHNRGAVIVTTPTLSETKGYT